MMKEEINIGTHYYQPDTFTGIYNGRKTLKTKFINLQLIGGEIDIVKYSLKEIIKRYEMLSMDDLAKIYKHVLEKINLLEREGVE